MTQEEKENELESLIKTKKGFDLDRSLCAGVLILVCYMTFSNDGIKTTPWYILLILGAVAAGAIITCVYLCFKINSLNKKIKELNDIQQ
ncbi:MAG: hypothetical protein J6Y36_06715 [Treponema sp.]|uniref:hypothetical protein n=1 Tax=Treponema sp. TaxID=166 RepID=UPI001B5C2493|nr:hypothetical protein [Treponema sp.]MBP5402834.1 hypothetical protein [Treponema sp.]MBR5933631.1 hypothetical protein [Treponema sp.]